ncbi:MAG: SPOR domain-containing protein [Bdellovibrionales bacterium]
MLNQRGASKSGTLIKMTQALVLLLFVSLLAFSAGTFIGKKVSDSEHRRAQLEGEYKAVASHDEHGNAGQDVAGEENLSEDDIASLTEEFVTKEKEAVAEENGKAEEQPAREVASAPEASTGYKKFNGEKGKPAPAATEHAPAHDAHAAPTAKAAAEPKHTAEPKKHAVEPAHKAEPPMIVASPKSAPSPMAARVAEGHAPAPDAKEERKPLSVLPSIAATAVGKYTVQVASYPDEAEAKNHAANLKGKGWNAFYVPADVQGKTWYRVSVGLFTNAKSAADFRKEFQKESNVATAIVQKIVK